jgi:hypothetical protein
LDSAWLQVVKVDKLIEVGCGEVNSTAEENGEFSADRNMVRRLYSNGSA